MPPVCLESSNNILRRHGHFVFIPGGLLPGSPPLFARWRSATGFVIRVTTRVTIENEKWISRGHVYLQFRGGTTAPLRGVSTAKSKEREKGKKKKEKGRKVKALRLKRIQKFRRKLQFPRNLIFQGWRVEHSTPDTIFATEAAERRRPRPFFPSSQEVIETNTLAETSVFRLLAFFFWFKSGSIWKLNELCPATKIPI